MNTKERDRLKVLHELQQGHFTQGAAAQQLGVTDRWVRKLPVRVKKEGDGGIVHRLRGRASNRRLAESLRAQALKLVKAKYGDFGPTLACEYLTKEHAVEVSKETLRQWIMAAGLRRGKRRPVERCTCGGSAGVSGESWCKGTRRSTTGWKGGDRGCTWWP